MGDTRVFRIEVRPTQEAGDPLGRAMMTAARSARLDDVPERIDSAAIYLLEGALDDAHIERLAHELLADPVAQIATIGAAETDACTLIEVHPQPGVMDPEAEAVEGAIEALINTPVTVRTGRRWDLHGIDAQAANTLARRCLSNPLIHDIHSTPHHPEAFEHGHVRPVEVRSVQLTGLDDEALNTLSREAHLFLSLDEMRAIQAHYATAGREPREIELETLAQTWSEHCVHKTLKATIDYHGDLPRPIPDTHPTDSGALRIDNLLKRTVAAATHTLMADGLDEWCLSVFVDNAGIVGFDDDTAVCFKVETHNHPSALEPYGGAATGIGGCIRDVLGTGLAARPIAATDVFCVAPLGIQAVPEGCLHPRRILNQVVAGVRDYGNRMGIPTLNGGVWFDHGHVGNPLVFCGCVGVMPRDRTHGDPRSGDRIIAVGGRTGRDGIHGATFSSAELTDTHADEFSHAVQIGNAITEKKVLDAILEMRDHASGCLFSAITDCGAGGFSSAVGEMGEHLGATVQLERAPLKYVGLTPVEIWISEAQERMVMSVPEDRVQAIADICADHEVEWCDLGQFGTEGAELILNHGDVEVGRLSMDFMHNGLPDRVREARWTPPQVSVPASTAEPDIGDTLLSLLAHPNIAARSEIIRQYDHEVQGRTILKPHAGLNAGPADAAVVTPVRGSTRGLAIANGLATGLCSDPYHMVTAAIDECVRNLVCVGTDPSRIAILDNYCWPGCDDPDRLGALVRASAACHDAGIAYRTPFISGKDSLNNQFTTETGETIRIPATMLISGFGIVDDIRSCVTMDAKHAGHLLVLVGETSDAVGGSHLLQVASDAPGDRALPSTDLVRGPATARAVARAIAAGQVYAAHDASEGGALLAAAEMAFAGGIGLALDMPAVRGDLSSMAVACFAETPSRYLVEVCPNGLDALADSLGDTPHRVIGRFDGTNRLHGDSLNTPLNDLHRAWANGLRL
ncbi:MAG: phosphoribosylformylglycinamidine synthase subunit PurL [Phycisphaerales bacterium]|nr:phosphoribosylformylglycinamidine synthase subunit PurL [Phycisphaerales bacterium]